MKTLSRAALLGLLLAGGCVSAQAEENRGVVTSVQGVAIHIDGTLYRKTLRSRQGETLGDLSEAFWESRMEFEVGDEVVFDTTDSSGQELDYILRLIK